METGAHWGPPLGAQDGEEQSQGLGRVHTSLGSCAPASQEEDWIPSVEQGLGEPVSSERALSTKSILKLGQEEGTWGEGEASGRETGPTLGVLGILYHPPTKGLP